MNVRIGASEAVSAGRGSHEAPGAGEPAPHASHGRGVPDEAAALHSCAACRTDDERGFGRGASRAKERCRGAAQTEPGAPESWVGRGAQFGNRKTIVVLLKKTNCFFR